MFMPKLTLAAFTACAIRSSLAQDAKNIVDTAVAAGDFTSLTTLVGLADLAGALSDPNASLTVLAPNDDAFAKLDNATVAKLTDPLYLPQLQQVLLSHVVDGTVTSGMVVDGLEATTLSGEKITFNTDPIRINEQSVVTLPDIMASNGVIHVIDNVIASQAVSKTIADLAIENDSLSTLVAALTAAGLVEALSGDGPITCVVPTDDAFAKLPEGTVPALLAEIPKLTEILLTHCFEGNVVSSMVTSGPITTLSGNTIDAVVTDEGISFDGSNVILPDLVASNGVVHVIDQVIVPSISDEPAATMEKEDTMMGEDHDHEHDGDDHSMDKEDTMMGMDKEDSTEAMPTSAPSSAAMYGTAVATAVVSAAFAMLL